MRASLGIFAGGGSLLGLTHCGSAHDFHLHDDAGAGASAGASGASNASGGHAGAGYGGTSTGAGTSGTGAEGGSGGSGGAGASTGAKGGSGGTKSSGAGGGTPRGGSGNAAGDADTTTMAGAAGEAGDDGGEAGANACEGVACQHGGSCRPTSNSYECECPAGYDGTLCEHDIDDCASNPCQHGGTCHDGVNAYTCACTGGYFGTNCETAHFEWLGVQDADARGISADGKVVVGSIPGVSSDVPARWTEETGFVALQSLSVAVDEGYASAANADGSVIVGQADLAGGGGAFRWTAAEGVVSLGLDAASRATGVSSNGVIVAGTMYGAESTPLEHAFRWTAATGAQDLASLGTGAVDGMNGDGTALVGSNSASSENVPFLWTQTSGLVRLGTDAGSANAVSFDGKTVVGGAEGGAFVYASTGGFSYMSLPGFTGGSAAAVNGDGTVIGGSSDQGSWLWDSTQGVRLVTDLLTGLGVDLTGYTTLVVNGISRDGKVFTGHCYNTVGYTSYIARL